MKRETHLGVYALIHEKGRMALILKNRGPYTGCWDLPGGRIEFGETPVQALAREVYEEIGLQLLTATPLDNLSTCVSFENENGEATELHHIGIIYACGVAAPEELRRSGDDQDASEARWVPVDEAEGLGLTPFARILVARVTDESRDES
jgi:8-oxo-dGTP diphosphatase